MTAMKRSRALFRAFVQAAAEWHKKWANQQQDFESVRERELIHHRDRYILTGTEFWAICFSLLERIDS